MLPAACPCGKPECVHRRAPAARHRNARAYEFMLEPLRNELEVEMDKMDQSRILASIGMRCLMKPSAPLPSAAPDGESAVAAAARLADPRALLARLAARALG